jgi:hypothetical protein
MEKVIDFQAAVTSKHQEKQEAQELEGLKEHFLGLISRMTQAEVIDLIDAIQRNDQDKYLAITNPVIIRKAIREFNT